MMLYRQCARLMPSARPVVVAQLYVQTDLACPLGKQLTIGQADQLASQLPTGNGEAQLRPNAGWLTGSQRYTREPGTQSLVST
jgi:hypothetical protein